MTQVQILLKSLIIFQASFGQFQFVFFTAIIAELRMIISSCSSHYNIMIKNVNRTKWSPIWPVFYRTSDFTKSDDTKS